jgi:hypothetical protein
MRNIIYTVLLLPVIAFAVSAYPGELKLQQNDGSTFRGVLHGDEWFHWAEDKNSKVVIYNNTSKNYEYGVIKMINGVPELRPSGTKAGVFIRTNTQSSDPSVSEMGVIDRKVLMKIWKRKREAARRYLP